ncbi:type II secretion system GspH family protein [Patescibacteria group bacterium]|nr:type II secretion system GspH family protein [Patescibacteria group bacterium]
MNKEIKQNGGMTHSMLTQCHPEYSRGMTYVELIVVLSIFAVLSSVAVFNYGDFQAKVDIKNLASDIALKIVEAQKSSINGALPMSGYDPDTWKPSYGVYFDLSTPKQFIYFADLDNNPNTYDAGELLNTINITKNNYILNIDKCLNNSCLSGSNPIDILFITFKRPDSEANFLTSPSLSFFGSEYVQITIMSPKGVKALIKIYPSGRLEIN